MSLREAGECSEGIGSWGRLLGGGGVGDGEKKKGFAVEATFLSLPREQPSELKEQEERGERPTPQEGRLSSWSRMETRKERGLGGKRGKGLHFIRKGGTSVSKTLASRL